MNQAMRGALGALLAVVLGNSPAAAGAPLPQSLDLTAVRAVAVQSDGRWPPLDTLARDLVESVTGSAHPDGNDPVLVLLAWTFDPETWMRAPLITIGSAELRGELQLPAMRAQFSYAELAGHRPLIMQIEALAQRRGGSKLNPLESKVAEIRDRLNTLHAVFAGYAITLIPNAHDPGGAWSSLADLRSAGDAQIAAVQSAWSALRTAFLADDAPGFASAARALDTALAALPAAYRPSAKRIATELHSNRLQPFTIAWQIMAAGAVLAAVALARKRRTLDGLAIVVMVAGFAMLSYGLYLRWQIAGRIPAANMFESLLFLSWGMGAFGIISMIAVRDRVVPLTASAMGALALFLADVLPLDGFIRPIPPVLRDTVWMSIHVPVIMVSYSVLALAMLVAHAQIVVMAVAPARRRLSEAIDRIHYWYVHVGSILLLAGIATGSMWAASSWGRYWGWDPKEVWSLIALLAYLTILHVRVDRQVLPGWSRVLGALLLAGVFALIIPQLAPMYTTKAIALLSAAIVIVFFISVHGHFATALKSIVAFWTIIMTYLGVNYVLGIGLHSYGFGTGAMVRYMTILGLADLGMALVCGAVYLARRGLVTRTADAPARAPISA